MATTKLVYTAHPSTAKETRDSATKQQSPHRLMPQSAQTRFSTRSFVQPSKPRSSAGSGYLRPLQETHVRIAELYKKCSSHASQRPQTRQIKKTTSTRDEKEEMESTSALLRCSVLFLLRFVTLVTFSHEEGISPGSRSESDKDA